MSALVAEGYELGLESQVPYLRIAQQPEVIVVPQLPEDETLRQNTEYKIRSIGLTALSNEVEQNPTANDSLLSAIKRGHNGDSEALMMVAANVGSDFSERVLKAGEVSKYYLQTNQNGELEQHGQLYSDIYANTLGLTPFNSKMRPRAEAEARNANRIQYWSEQGKLNDSYMVVFSLAPNDMTDEELKDAGFFAQTKTMAIQATTATDSGVSIESGFVAGIAKPELKRHDIQTIIKIAEALGVDYGNMTVTEILDTPLLIPKSLMPNGVIDLVELYDELAGGTFFGEAKPRQDYLDFRAYCDERRKSFARDVTEVTAQLLSQAPNLRTPLQAINKLDELSEAQMVKRAVKDKTIDARVFGGEAAGYIEQARIHYELGNTDLMFAAEKQAIKTADSNSCPSGVARQSELDIESSGSSNKENNDTKDCEYISKKCPVCGEKNAKTKVSKGKYYHVGKSCKA